MSSRDLKSNIDFLQSLAPASYGAVAVGVGVDLREYASAMVLISAGEIGGTSASFTFEVQESDDNSTFSAVADADLQGDEPVLTAGNVVHRLGYKGQKRYIRAAITAATGTGPSLVCEAGVLRGEPRMGPL